MVGGGDAAGAGEPGPGAAPPLHPEGVLGRRLAGVAHPGQDGGGRAARVRGAGPAARHAPHPGHAVTWRGAHGGWRHAAAARAHVESQHQEQSYVQ